MIEKKKSNIIIEKLKPYHPKMIGIFGSYARNENHQQSDLDILVTFEPTVNLLEIIGLEIELSEILGVKVDLVTQKALNPQIEKYVMKDLKIIFND